MCLAKERSVIVYSFLMPRKLLLLTNQKVCCQMNFSVSAGNASMSALNELFFFFSQERRRARIFLRGNPFLWKRQSCSWVIYINCLHDYWEGWLTYFIDWNSNKCNYAAVIDLFFSVMIFIISLYSYLSVKSHILKYKNFIHLFQ